MSTRTVVDFRTLPFIRVTKSVVDNDEVLETSADIAVYTVLCMYADNVTAEAHPKIKTIAKKSRCSESSVKRSLKRLEDAGYIEIRKRYGSNGHRISSQYVLLNVNVD